MSESRRVVVNLSGGRSVAVSLGPKGEKGDSFQVDATGLFSGRSAHDAEPAGFSYLATDQGNLYIRQGVTPGVWSAAIPFRGPQGDQGIQGVQGLQGTQGAAGADGSVWRDGVGPPAGSLGVVKDWYLNRSNGDYYEKTASSAYTLRGNLKGPQGDQGIQGAPGSVLRSGTGAPSGALGVVGDWYLNDANGDVYEKTGASAYTLRDNLTGPQGIQGIQGIQGEPGTPGDPASTFQHPFEETLAAAGTANVGTKDLTICDTTAGAFSVAVPSPATRRGYEHSFVKLSDTPNTNLLTIAFGDGEFVHPQTGTDDPLTTEVERDAVTIRSNGEVWFVTSAATSYYG